MKHNYTKIKTDLSRDFEIIENILKTSRNYKYKIDMLNRIKKLNLKVFGIIEDEIQNSKYIREKLKFLRLKYEK